MIDVNLEADMTCILDLRVLKALAQCQTFLSASLPSAKRVPTASTAGAAQSLLEPGNERGAAICARNVVDVVEGLRIVSEGVEDMAGASHRSGPPQRRAKLTSRPRPARQHDALPRPEISAFRSRFFDASERNSRTDPALPVLHAGPIGSTIIRCAARPACSCAISHRARPSCGRPTTDR